MSGAGLPVSQAEDTKEASGNEIKDVDTCSEAAQCELEKLPPLQKLEPLTPVLEETEPETVCQPVVQETQNFFIKVLQCGKWCIFRQSRFAQRKRA